MKRLLATLLLLAATACQPITPPVTPAASATAFATIPATQEPPLYYLHPRAIAVGIINVMQAFCHSKHTTIAVYEHAVEWHYDDTGETDCLSRGVLQ